MSDFRLLPDCLARRPNEEPTDHVQRMLVEPLCLGATDAELAELCDTSPGVVRSIRQDWLHDRAMLDLLCNANAVANQCGYRAGAIAFLNALVRKAAKAAQSRAEASRESGATSHHPVDKLPTGGEAGTTKPDYGGARPREQSSGAPGTRNLGGGESRGSTRSRV